MSIILDALERVENNRNLEKKIEATLEPGLEEGTEVELTQDYHSPLSKKHSRRIGKSSINVVIGIIFLCVVAGLYFLLDDDAGNTETQTETPASDSEFVTETIDKSDDSANKAIAFEELENQFFNSSEEVDINRLPQDASPETKPELLNTTTVEKITPAITNIPEQKTSENQAILRSENTPANKKSEKPEIVAKEVEITSASDIETGSVDAVVSAPKEITETTNKPMSPANWIARGKTKFRKKGLAAAAVIWNKGFTSLSPTTPVISIMINHVSDLAIQTLNQLYQHDIDAFAVKGVFKHKPAYFTLALQPEGKTGALIANIEDLTDGKPFVTTQAYISKRMDGLLPVKISRAAPIKENKPIKIKKLSNRERLKIAEEAVIKGEYKLAIKKLRPVLFNSQGDWEVLFWIGSAKLGLGLYGEADDYFKKALAYNSDIAQIWTQRAIIAQEKNDHELALRFLHKAQKLKPDTPETVLNIAYSNDALGDKNGAVLAYREFLLLTKGSSAYGQQRQAVRSRLEELGY